ncbi:hypothetical protein FKM82_010335 [Ascaphus truei]
MEQICVLYTPNLIIKDITYLCKSGQSLLRLRVTSRRAPPLQALRPVGKKCHPRAATRPLTQGQIANIRPVNRQQVPPS